MTDQENEWMSELLDEVAELYGDPFDFTPIEDLIEWWDGFEWEEL
ncbi:MAG: hypothetical protein VW496_05030 [Pelagibacteraceae bacterium]